VTLLIVLLVALIALAGAAWVVFSHPMGLILTTMFALASAPTLKVPGIHAAVIGPLALMCLAARFTGRWEFRPPRWAEASVMLLILTSLFSLTGNQLSGHSVRDFLIWALMSSLVVPLSALRPAELGQAGRAYALGAGLGALFGLALRLGDPHARLIGHLAFLGYTPQTIALVPTQRGASTLRLTGTYLDPNVAGLMMTFGLVLALALLRGKVRVLTCVVLLAAIGLTFSRAALGSIVVGAVLLLVAGRMPSGTRRALSAVGAVAAAFLFAVPAVRWRVRNSFGSTDIGSMARGAALNHFPRQMSGHWLLGRGFGLTELTNGAAAYANANNIVANAPLLTVYRGGLLVGLVFMSILVIGVVRSWRLIRHGSMAAAALGAGVLGLILVALQLDYPVVTLAPTVAMFSVWLVFLDERQVVDALPPESRASTSGMAGHAR